MELSDTLSYFDIKLAGHMVDGKTIADAFDDLNAKSQRTISDLTGQIEKSQIEVEDAAKKLEKRKRDRDELEGRMKRLRDLTEQSQQILRMQEAQTDKLIAEKQAAEAKAKEDKSRLSALELLLTQSIIEFGSSATDKGNDAEGKPEIKVKGIDPTVVKLGGVKATAKAGVVEASINSALSLAEQLSAPEQSAADEIIENQEANAQAEENKFLQGKG